MTAETTPDATIAAEFVGPLWTAIRSADGPRPAKDHHHLIRGLFDAAWLGSLPLLVGKDRSEKQSVALGSAMQFERHPTSEALDGAYAARPRTRIYEGYDARTGGWPAMVTRILMRLADCRVVCSVYESSARDQNLGPHRDGWYGAVVQMLGEKAWLLGDGADDPSAEPTLLLSPGDVLMVPKGVLHDVRTPDHSVHMAFALITDEPQLSPQNSPK